MVQRHSASPALQRRVNNVSFLFFPISHPCMIPHETGNSARRPGDGREPQPARDLLREGARSSRRRTSHDGLGLVVVRATRSHSASFQLPVCTTCALGLALGLRDRLRSLALCLPFAPCFLVLHSRSRWAGATWQNRAVGAQKAPQQLVLDGGRCEEGAVSAAAARANGREDAGEHAGAMGLVCNGVELVDALH